MALATAADAKAANGSSPSPAPKKAPPAAPLLTDDGSGGGGGGGGGGKKRGAKGAGLSTEIPPIAPAKPPPLKPPAALKPLDFTTEAGLPMTPAQIHGHLKNLTANAAKVLDSEVAALVAIGKVTPKSPPAHLIAEAKAKADTAAKDESERQGAASFSAGRQCDRERRLQYDWLAWRQSAAE